MSQTDAEAACVAAGGNLASIHSDADQEAARQACMSASGDADGFAADCWIGLSDSATEGTFVWTDGTPNDYQHWAPGEPNAWASQATCTETATPSVDEDAAACAAACSPWCRSSIRAAVMTAADGAVMNLTVFAAITGAVAGMWFWSPKIGGHLLPSGMGSLVMVDLVGAGVLLGVAGMVTGFDLGSGLDDAMAIVATIGAVLGLLGALGVIASILKIMRSDADAGDDPWGGHTLEWAAAPPARVMSESPLLDAAETSDDEGGES